MDITGPAHIFYEAKAYGADIDLHFVSMSYDTKIESTSGLNFSDLVPFQQFESSVNDIIFVPGMDYHLFSDTAFIERSSTFFKWLQREYEKGVTVCSVCTGAFLLAEAGILNGKSCTTHWRYFSEFYKNYPQVELKKNRLFVVSSNVYTSAGVSSGIDLSLFLLENEYGPKLAADVAKEAVVYFRRSECDPQLSIYLQYRNHQDTRVHDAQDFIETHLSEAFTLEELGEYVNMSVRNLTRRYKNTTGITIGAYLERLRFEKAVNLLEQNHKIDFVAGQVGLKSTNQLRTILKKYKASLPKNHLPIHKSCPDTA